MKVQFSPAHGDGLLRSPLQTRTDQATAGIAGSAAFAAAAVNASIEQTAANVARATAYQAMHQMQLAGATAFMEQQRLFALASLSMLGQPTGYLHSPMMTGLPNLPVMGAGIPVEHSTQTPEGSSSGSESPSSTSRKPKRRVPALPIGASSKWAAVV